MGSEGPFREYAMPLRVYIEDTDAGGIVYYVNYLKFMERTRTEFLRSLGFDHYLTSDEDFMFVVHHVDVNYHKPARMDDLLTATAQLISLGKASFVFKQTIQRDTEILCSGQIKIACVTRKQLKPRSIPEQLVSLLKAYGSSHESR